MHDLASFGVSDMMALRAAMRALGTEGAPSIEEAAQAMVRLFREQLVDGQGRPACALVRLYKTHPFAALDDDLRAFALRLDPAADAAPDLRCLVLLASAGDLPEWNDRRLSRGHQAIPLSNEVAVSAAPMIFELIVQFGLEVAMVVRPPAGLLLDVMDRAQNVFYVQQAAGSPSIPAQQDFVMPHGIQSVIGFGGMVASGALFAAILFSRVAVTPGVADLFKVVGLNFKLAMLPIASKPLLAGG